MLSQKTTNKQFETLVVLLVNGKLNFLYGQIIGLQSLPAQCTLTYLILISSLKLIQQNASTNHWKYLILVIFEYIF